MNQADVDTSVLNDLDFEVTCQVRWTRVTTGEITQDYHDELAAYDVDFTNSRQQRLNLFMCESCFKRSTAIDHMIIHNVRRLRS